MVLKPIGSVCRMWSDVTYSSFTDSLVELMLFSQMTLCKPNEYIYYDKATISWHSGARNQLVQEFQGDWLFQCDTDHVFAPDLLVRLIRMADKHNCGVISGSYQYKFPPHAPVANLWGGQDNNGVIPIKDWDRTQEILEVGPMPAGCLWVRREIFNKVRAATKQEPFDNIGGLSEDYSFCKRCKDLGIPVYWAPEIECHHTVRTVLHKKDYVPQGPMIQAPSTDGKVLI